MKASVGVNVSVHVRVWLWIEREEVERAMVLSSGDAVLHTIVLVGEDDGRKCVFSRGALPWNLCFYPWHFLDTSSPAHRQELVMAFNADFHIR